MSVEVAAKFSPAHELCLLGHSDDIVILTEYVREERVVLEMGRFGDVLSDSGVAQVTVITPHKDLLCFIINANAEVSPTLH